MTTIDPKPLPTTVHRHSVFHELVRREGAVAMYSLRYVASGPIVGFDVGRVRTVPDGLIHGKYAPSYEAFPASEAFGTSWWSWTSREAADKCFAKLLKRGDEHGYG
jgi:hypothetical protein